VSPRPARVAWGLSPRPTGCGSDCQQRRPELPLYPAHATTPGLVNPDISQANIDQTICSTQLSTRTIRPPSSYTDRLKRQQLAKSHLTDKSPAHYEEDHLVSLELGGHPHDPRNLWPERWGTPAHPAHAPRAVPDALGRGQGQDREHAPRRGLPPHVDTAGGANSSSSRIGSSTTGTRCSSETPPRLTERRAYLA